MLSREWGVQLAEIVEWVGGVLLRDGKDVACFIPAEMRLFNVEAQVGLTLSEIAAKLAARYPGGKIQTPQRMDRREAMFPILREEDAAFTGQSKPRLGRLTLNVSNVCNMACGYCYASKGHYNQPEGLMSPETARDLLRRVMQLYGQIDVLHFFGGEPLLNLRTIESVAAFLTEATGEGALEKLPRFALTTNGTLASQEAIDALLHWKIGVTVSWDGTREVQDRCRPMRSGLSSYEVLADSLSRLRYAEVPFDIECTYNGHHQQMGIHIRDLMEFFYNETGQRYLHITPAFLPTEGASAEGLSYAALAEDYRDAARFSVENLIKGEGPVLRFVQRVAEHLASRRPAEAYCPAFFTQLNVTMDGAVYPCFMLAGKPEFHMGNLLLETYPGEASLRVLRRYFDEFYSRETSWYSSLTEGCVAGEMLVSGSMREPVMALVQQAIAEECLLGLSRHLSEKMLVRSSVTAGV